MTKGFTQNCTASDESCTGSYQQDRVDILREYADYSWSLDPTHYAIFEHLGSNFEEQQWANYRIAETPSKGVMMWGKLTDNYNNLSMGFASNISGMTSSSRGFTANRLMGYAESHDEERLMYKNLQFGNSTNSAHNVKNLNVALSRMSAIGAVSLLIPGPKMIWQFGELGWEYSIFTCNNGTVNTSNDAIAGDCKLDSKPQPQWVSSWLDNTNRNAVYTNWAKMITLKQAEPVFSGTAVVSNTSSLFPNIKITNSNLLATQLKDVLIIANFDVTTQSVATGFPYTGTWYNLMDNTSITVTNTTTPISLPAGEFRIYGNKTAALAIASFESNTDVNLYPNPSQGNFLINAAAKQVLIYNMIGQLVKEFKGDFGTNYNYGINELTTGTYLVKVVGEDNKASTLKLIKQ